jgi:mxaJ protein
MGVPAEDRRRAHHAGVLPRRVRVRVPPDRVRGLRSFDDARLRSLRVGVPLVGNDMAATPPARSARAARRGRQRDRLHAVRRDSVAERMVAALADGTLDVALLWAPQAAYYARRQDFEVALGPARDAGGDPSDFGMAMGVRRGDTELRDALSAAITRAAPRIDAVLREFGLDDAPLRAAAGQGS